MDLATWQLLLKVLRFKILPLHKISSYRQIFHLKQNHLLKILVSLDIPEVSDQVGVMSITNDAPEVFPLGETIVTWTATDVVGNVSTISHSILID